ncbi:MAG: hypothetical protein ABJN14_21620 [Paracoccaceae bacterium]
MPAPFCQKVDQWLLLHFAERTPKIIAAAGAIVGVGILALHYIGMAGLEQPD